MNFKVLGNLKHDMTDYKAGDIVDMEKDRGMALVEAGVLGIMKGAKESSFSPDADDEDMPEKSYDDMKVPQLVEIAEAKGIETKGLLKAEIIEALKKPKEDTNEEEDNEENELDKETEEESEEDKESTETEE